MGLEDKGASASGEMLVCHNPQCMKAYPAEENTIFCGDCRHGLQQGEGAVIHEEGLVIPCLMPECRTQFASDGNSLICPTCQRIQERARSQNEDAAYEVIKRYVDRHPYATVDDVHIHTHVEIQKIKTLIEEGRIQLVLLPKCEKCAKPIASQQFKQLLCDRCMGRVQHDIMRTLSEPGSVFPYSHPSARSRRYGFGRE